MDSTRAVEGEAWSPLIDDAWTPVDNPHSDMTLSVIKSIKTSSTTFSEVELVQHTSSGQLAQGVK
jgi:hypothetical protein